MIFCPQPPLVDRDVQNGKGIGTGEGSVYQYGQNEGSVHTNNGLGMGNGAMRSCRDTYRGKKRPTLEVG